MDTLAEYDSKDTYQMHVTQFLTKYVKIVKLSRVK